MKIYVAGKMCGLPGFGFEGFDKARDILVQAGHEVISPADIDRKKYPNHNFSSGEPPEGFDYTETLLHDLRIISECDAVYALYNWNDSKGAKAEVYFAKAIGKKILYETHLVRSSRTYPSPNPQQYPAFCNYLGPESVFPCNKREDHDSFHNDA